MKRLSFLIFSGSSEVGEELSWCVESAGGDVREVVWGDLREALKRHQPEVLVVGLEPDPEKTLEALESLPELPNACFVVGRADDSGVIHRALRLGVSDFLPYPLDANGLSAAVQNLAPNEETPGSSPAPVIAVMGCKGGVGASSIASQLSTALRELGSDVALVDPSGSGDVAVQLELRQDHAYSELCRRGAEIDIACVDRALQVHPSGVRCLATPAPPPEAETAGGSWVPVALPLLRGRFDWVVVDAGRGRTPGALRALELATQILLVTDLDVASLHGARRALARLRERCGGARVRVVLNRNGRRGGGVTETDVAEFLERGADAALPNDPAALAVAVNQGRSLGRTAPSSPLRRGFLELARELHTWCGRPRPQAPAEQAPGFRSVLRRLRTRPPRRSPAPARPRSYRVLTVTSNKGGVAKTTLATNLAVYFRALREDLPVLIVGFDDQPMLDRMFSFQAGTPAENTLTAMRAGTFTSALRLGQYGVHYVPSSDSVGELKREIDDIFHLRRVLERTAWRGLVILDTKSDFEILTRNAVAAADMSLVVVHDQASLIEARKVYEFLDRIGKPRDRARVALSLVDRRIKFRGEGGTDVLGHLVTEVRRLGYPLFESFVSRSPKVEGLYTNPQGRAVSILHGARDSLVHLQMSHLANDVLTALESIQPPTRAGSAARPTATMGGARAAAAE